MCVTKIFKKKTSTDRSLWSSGDVSEGEYSDFEGDRVYSCRSDAFGAISNIEELNSSPLPAIASGDEEPLSSDSEWLPSLQQDTTTGKSICQVEYRKVKCLQLCRTFSTQFTFHSLCLKPFFLCIFKNF